ncbi:hypothetical protein BpHYR1_026661 [Brachionus plicatilis]|uniref:Uncharacterized protein n=1 Tax=Brachionus plicatilis TaxID=10195 RepID=A0A3M7RV33_BRAPC|nr:hypothetical protein BpHYR1_026661 [Brachionus plicatilis]
MLKIEFRKINKNNISYANLGKKIFFTPAFSRLNAMEILKGFTHPKGNNFLARQFNKNSYKLEAGAASRGPGPSPGLRLRVNFLKISGEENYGPLFNNHI